MKSNAKNWHSKICRAATVLTLTATPALLSAQVITPGDAEAATGKTYGEWSSIWWQYAVSKPVTDPNNPLGDETGARCGASQPRSSPVFFLSGTVSGEAIRDECKVPAGKVLFFPLANAFDVHTPGDAIPTAELARAELLTLFGPITELHASIDGVPIGVDLFSYRACAGGDPACSAAFSLTFPGNNFIGKSEDGVPFLRAGVYSPAVADGYYLMLEPLPPGPHTINFGAHGSFAGLPLVQEITYNLEVKEH